MINTFQYLNNLIIHFCGNKFANINQYLPICIQALSSNQITSFLSSPSFKKTLVQIKNFYLEREKKFACIELIIFCEFTAGI